MLTRREFLIALGLMGLLSQTACSGSKGSHGKLPAGARTLCLGDSLTYGYSSSDPSTKSYPSLLAAQTGLVCDNEGVNGDTTAGALQRLNAIISSQKSYDFAIVSIGGNDFLKKIPEGETRSNIKAIIAKIREAGWPQILIGIPTFSTGALLGNVSDHPLYGEIAKEEGVPLLSNAWSSMLEDKSLRSDLVHGNDKGYEFFTGKLVKFLKNEGFI